jgi:serine/threonine-protein kinase
MDADGSIRDCKVLDFGVSKLTVADAATTGDITLSGNVVGTPEYMAPEQVRAGKHADHRIDIYSLGVVFYEMLAGRPPFVGEHFSGLMLDIMQRDPPPLASLREDVPRRLSGVIHRALARDLDKRFPDMPSFIMAVEAVGRDELKLAMGTPPEGLITQIAMPRLTPDGQFPAPKDRRGLGVAAAIGLGLIAGGTWLWLDTRGQPARPETPAPAASAAVAPAEPQPSPPSAPPAAEPAAAVAPTEAPSSGTPAAPSASAEARAGEAPAMNKAKAEAKPTPAVAAHPLHRPSSRAPAPASDQEPAKVPVKAETTRPPGSLLPARSSSPSNQKPRAGKLSVDDF